MSTTPNLMSEYFERRFANKQSFLLHSMIMDNWVQRHVWVYHLSIVNVSPADDAEGKDTAVLEVRLYADWPRSPFLLILQPD